MKVEAVFRQQDLGSGELLGEVHCKARADGPVLRGLEPQNPVAVPMPGTLEGGGQADNLGLGVNVLSGESERCGRSLEAYEDRVGLALGLTEVTGQLGVARRERDCDGLWPVQVPLDAQVEAREGCNHACRHGCGG